MARKAYILGSPAVLGLRGAPARRGDDHPFTPHPVIYGPVLPGLAATGPCILPRRARMAPEGPAARAPRGSAHVPGYPTRTTGVPNKYVRPAAGRPRRQSAQTSRNSLPTGRARTYRGPQQVLPGSPTSATGVPNKNYRGPQQASLFKIAAKRGLSSRASGSLCFCFSCSVMLLNNNYRENGEVYPWGPIASN
jgi:hypothetical protein